MVVYTCRVSFMIWIVVLYNYWLLGDTIIRNTHYHLKVNFYFSKSVLMFI